MPKRTDNTKDKRLVQFGDGQWAMRGSLRVGPVRVRAEAVRRFPYALVGHIEFKAFAVDIGDGAIMGILVVDAIVPRSVAHKAEVYHVVLVFRLMAHRLIWRPVDSYRRD